MLTLAVALALHGCPQQVRVAAPSARSTVASVVVVECGRRVLGPFRAHVGANGLSSHHREGDGTTPLGTFPLRATVYGLDPRPPLHLRYHRLVCGDWWDEDPSSPTYNRFRHFACGFRPPFRGGSEALWQATVAYRLFAVVDYNTAPAVPGRGSAIFVHVDLGHATNGCVSLPRPQLLAILELLRPGATIRIALAA
jgi:L,D-peptidoglycan transpeptidase YkuD (ErfK/YbiS/YcfS/YnhG family)